jgi:molybdopterin molybdotransferase
VGVLVSVGEFSVEVRRQPRVNIVVTGDEVRPPRGTPGPFTIFDANSPMLSALIERDGGKPHTLPIVQDDRDELRAALQGCDGDVILVSGGTSVGEEDHAPTLLAELGELVVHGVAMRPSAPTGFGFIDGRPVFLLPGNPVSCLCAYDFFAGPTIRALGGRSREWPYRTVEVPVGRKITSTTGRVDYARVKIIEGRVEPLMVSGASILSSTTRADGVVIVPRDDEGIPAGATVTVHLYG